MFGLIRWFQSILGKIGVGRKHFQRSKTEKIEDIKRNRVSAVPSASKADNKDSITTKVNNLDNLSGVTDVSSVSVSNATTSDSKHIEQKEKMSLSDNDKLDLMIGNDDLSKRIDQLQINSSTEESDDSAQLINSKNDESPKIVSEKMEPISEEVDIEKSEVEIDKNIVENNHQKNGKYSVNETECTVEDIEIHEKSENTETEIPQQELRMIHESTKGDDEEGIAAPVNDIGTNSNKKSIEVDVRKINTDYQSLALDTNDFNSIIKHLSDKIDSGKLIGFDLLQIINNTDLIQEIHNRAIKDLTYNYNKSQYLYYNRGEIILSLVLIAQEFYDGNYWDHVKDVYYRLYLNKSEQKVDAMIRTIISYYSSQVKNLNTDNRYIDYVIRHSIIPMHYLPDYISFAFDIYKNTFKCEIMDDMDTILASIFVEISTKYINQEGTIETSTKTYKLIKTTKDIIDNIEWFGELIEYTSLILKYIDKYYWADRSITLPYGNYFDPVFQKWVSENKIYFAEHDQKRKEISEWKPTYLLQGNSIYLTIPNHIVRQIKDITKVYTQIVDGNKTVCELIRPEVTEVLGGYLIEGARIPLKTPFNKISYSIISDGSVLYSSNDLLYRDYIVFGDNQKELPNKCNYVGDVTVAARTINSDSNIDVFYSSTDYVLGSKNLAEFDELNINGDVISYSTFSGIRESKIEIADTIIRSHHHEFNLLKEFDALTISLNESPDDLILEINQKNYHIEEKQLIANAEKKHIYKINFLTVNNFGDEEMHG